jgi:hypothetical protein
MCGYVSCLATNVKCRARLLTLSIDTNDALQYPNSYQPVVMIVIEECFWTAASQSRPLLVR